MRNRKGSYRQASGIGAVVISVVLLAGMVFGAYMLARHSTPSDSARFGIGDLFSFELAAATGVSLKDVSSNEDPYWEVGSSTTPSTTPSDDTPVWVPPTNTEPEILVYCTHSNESYRKLETDTYKELANTRTMDPNYNILKVATVLTDTMKEENLPVLYDNTDHELGKYYTTSYSRSLATIEKNMAEHESLKVLLDIHRDATSAESGKNDFVTIDGKECARIMIVVGTGNGKTGSGFDERPDWEENLAFANKITDALREIHPNLARDVRIKTGRYNQHMSTSALAIEIGHNQNTLEQACNAAEYLAQALAKVLSE